MSKADKKEEKQFVINGELITKLLAIAEKYYKNGSDSDKLAASLISLNILEEWINVFIKHLYNVSNIITSEAYLKAYTSKKFVRFINKEPKIDELTLGQKLKYLNNHLFFQSKKELITLLEDIVEARTNIIHKMLRTTQKGEQEFNNSMERIFTKSKSVLYLSLNILNSINQAEIEENQKQKL